MPSDKERLDWLSQVRKFDNGSRYHNIDAITAIVGKGFSAAGSQTWHADLRVAVDEAMHADGVDAARKTVDGGM